MGKPYTGNRMELAAYKQGLDDARASTEALKSEMLEALEQALTHIEVDETTHGRNFAAGNVIRAVIAKAEGGQS